MLLPKPHLTHLLHLTLLLLPATITATPISDLSKPLPKVRGGPNHGLIFPTDLPDGIYTVPMLSLPDPATPSKSRIDPTTIELTPTLLRPLNLTSLPPQAGPSTKPAIARRQLPIPPWYETYTIYPLCKWERKIQETVWNQLVRDRVLSSHLAGDTVAPSSIYAVIMLDTVYYICNYHATWWDWANGDRIIDVDRVYLEPPQHCGRLTVGWGFQHGWGNSYIARGRERRGYEICWPGKKY